MPTFPGKDVRQTAWILVLALATAATAFWWQGRVGLNLWDEGYLWYGVQRVMAGQTPVLDFMSYDPGRYYYSAALMNAWGDSGIVALRATIAMFQAVGLFVALMLLGFRNNKINAPTLIIAAVTLAIWMHPRHKQYDITISIALVGALAFLANWPSNLRYFLAGAVVGVAAFFGCNHGAYGVMGSLAMAGYLAVKPSERLSLRTGVPLWCAGVLLGYSPMLLLMILDNSFFQTYLSNQLAMFQRGYANLSLPVPWPWLVGWDSNNLLYTTWRIITGLFFVALVVGGAFYIVYVIAKHARNKPTSSTVVAAACLTLPYAHVAFSRADISHLSQAVFPLIIGLFALLFRQKTLVMATGAVALLAASLLVMLPVQPAMQCRGATPCVAVEVAGDAIEMHPKTAAEVSLLKQLVDRFAPNGQSFLVAPFWPGAYAVFGRQAPLRETYALRMRDAEFQNAELHTIEAANPGFALIVDLPPDGREELRYQNSHPLIYKYIVDNFDQVDGLSDNPAYKIFKSRSN